MTRRLTLLPIALAAAAAFAAPATAQDAAGDKVKMVIVYGDDPAPAAQGDEIVVVARLPEGDRYRIPETLRFSDNPDNMTWAQRVERLDMVGKFGTMSCSPVGAGGFTGCTQELLQKAGLDKREGSDRRFSELIAAARAERLSTIDAEASAEQARVEALEKSYQDKLDVEREAPLPGEGERKPGDVGTLAQPPGQ